MQVLDCPNCNCEIKKIRSGVSRKTFHLKLECTEQLHNHQLRVFVGGDSFDQQDTLPMRCKYYDLKNTPITEAETKPHLAVQILSAGPKLLHLFFRAFPMLVEMDAVLQLQMSLSFFSVLRLTSSKPLGFVTQFIDLMSTTPFFGLHSNTIKSWLSKPIGAYSDCSSHTMPERPVVSCNIFGNYAMNTNFIIIGLAIIFAATMELFDLRVSSDNPSSRGATPGSGQHLWHTGARTR